MLNLYATEAIRNTFTLIYRGYELEVRRTPSGWLVGVHPRSAEVPFSQGSGLQVPP